MSKKQKNKMKIERTGRGFAITKFTDLYDVPCSIQKSSLAGIDAIWLGCDDPNPRYFIPNVGWQSIQLPENTVVNTQMHLTRKMVKKMLPILQRFAETGELE